MAPNSRNPNRSAGAFLAGLVASTVVVAAMLWMFLAAPPGAPGMYDCPGTMVINGSTTTCYPNGVPSDDGRADGNETSGNDTAPAEGNETAGNGTGATASPIPDEPAAALPPADDGATADATEEAPTAEGATDDLEGDATTEETTTSTLDGATDDGSAGSTLDDATEEAPTLANTTDSGDGLGGAVEGVLA